MASSTRARPDRGRSPAGRSSARGFAFFLAACAAIFASVFVAPLRASDPGPLDGLLSNIKVALTPEQRAEIARDAIAHDRWAGLSQLLSIALLSDTKSGWVDQIPWISRLRLAQAVTWLGTPERDFAPHQIELENQLFHQAPQNQPDVAWLDQPDGPQKLASVFGDAANFPRPEIIAHRIKPETLVALLSNAPLIDLLGETATLDDYQPGVWRVLADLQEHRPQGMVDHPALAVALAVVYDRAFPPDWPHHQVAREKVPFVWENWNALFDYFIDAQGQGTLFFDIDTLGTAQLRFLVDIPLDPSELDWAQQNVRNPLRTFDKVFFSIQYDQDRFFNWRMYWELPHYTLKQIAASGGICIDQAYFSAMAGKARGLPTLLFVGEGSFGGHAWFGYLKEDRTWVLNAGRYADQNYVTGTVRDPQTWAEINDHQLAFLSDTGDSRVVYNYSRNLLALALLPGVREDAARRQQLLAAALETDPKLPEIWEAVADTLRELGQTDALRKHYRAMAEQFAQQDDLHVEALRDLVPLVENDEAADLWKQILSSRSDLAVEGASAFVEERIKAGDLAGAKTQFDAFVPAFFKRGKTEKVSAGNLFYGLIVPYAYALDRAGHDDLALKMLDSVSNRFDLDSESNPLGRGFHYLQAQLTARAQRRAKGDSGDGAS